MTLRSWIALGFFGGTGLLIVAALIVALFPQLPAWIAAVLQVAGSLVGILIGYLIDQVRGNADTASRARSGIRQLFGQVDKLNGLNRQIVELSERVRGADGVDDVAGIGHVLDILSDEVTLLADSILSDVANWDDLSPGAYESEMTAVRDRRAILTADAYQGDGASNA